MQCRLGDGVLHILTAAMLDMHCKLLGVVCGLQEMMLDVSR